MAKFHTKLVLFVVVGGTLAAAVLPAASLAASPVIGAGSVSEIGESSATLQVQINSEGLKSSYEFWLEYATCQTSTGASCGTIVVKKVGAGYIGGTDRVQTVRAYLSSLQPAYTYSVWVVASNAAGMKETLAATFTTLGPTPPGQPSGSGGGVPYESKEEPWVQEGAEREAVEASRLEAERQARQKEAEERSAKEAAGRAGRELGGSSIAMHCIVPRLKGDSLRVAQRVLHRTHCRLGKIREPHRHNGALVVVKQSVQAGHKLPDGAAVAVRLGPAR